MNSHSTQLEITTNSSFSSDLAEYRRLQQEKYDKVKQREKEEQEKQEKEKQEKEEQEKEEQEKEEQLEKEKFALDSAKLKNYLNSVEGFDRTLEKFKKTFYQLFAETRLIETISELKKTLSTLESTANHLAQENILSKDLFQKTFEQCMDLLNELENNTSLLAQCFQIYVVPLIDAFWNFKYSLESYAKQFSTKTNQEDALIHAPCTEELKLSVSEETTYRNAFKIVTFFKTNMHKAETLSLSQLLKQFQTSAEISLPTLDEALRRAAATATPVEIDALLAFGADINAVDGEKQNTLHKAVIANKPVNVIYLLDKKALINAKDMNNKTPNDFANEINKPILIKIFHSYLHPEPFLKDILINIMSFLELDDLLPKKMVSKFWKTCVEERINQVVTKSGLNELEQNQFQKLSKFLQYLIVKHLIETNLDATKVRELLSALKLDHDNRMKLISSISALPPIYYVQQRVVSDTGLALHFLDIFTYKSNDWFRTSRSGFCLTYGAMMLVKGLVTPEQADTFYHSGSCAGPFDNFISLCTRNGLIALKEKLIDIKDAPYISALDVLLSDIGLQALREGLITGAQAKKFYHSGQMSGPFDNLQHLLTPIGLEALRKKVVTPEEVAKIFPYGTSISDKLTALVAKYDSEHAQSEPSSQSKVRIG